jgi:hypothetical protein
MASSIALDKIELLSFDEKYKATLDKFLVTYGLVSFDEMKQINDFLLSKGIVVKRPSQISVFLNSYDYIVTMVEAYEQSGDLKALQEDPKRISSKKALDRLNALKSSGLPYINDKGKYINDPFFKTLFESNYSSLNTTPVEPVVEAPVEETVNVETPIFEEPAPTQPTSAFSEASDDTIIINPITPEVEPTVEVASPIDESAFNNAVAEEVQDDNFANTEAVVDPISYILSNPQTIALNDDTFERYDRLSDNIRQILYKVYGIEEINDNIIDNLIKLVTNEIPDDEKVIFSAMTYGKTISEEEANQLISAIREELDYTNIMNLNLGR